MTKALKPWVLVLTGIIFNIISAVITHYFIGVNNQRLDELQMQAGRFDTLIESQWRSKTEIDRSREFLLLLLTQGTPDKLADIHQYINNQLSTIVQRQKVTGVDIGARSVPDFGIIEKVSKLAIEQIISTINDSYLEKLEVEKQQMPLRERNSLLFTISIFLQVTGLILVLSRDIMRRDL